MKRYALFICILLNLVFFNKTQAQVTSVFLNVTPENAQIGEVVTISASSYSEDLTRSNFTWTANGKVVKKGTGVTSISFRKTSSMPLVTIGVTINLTGGQTIQQSVDITNQSMDLLWEALDSYTPPFYKGKALPVTEGAVRFSPIITRGSVFGTNANKNNIYTWSRSNDVVGTASGTGKDSFPIVMDYLLDKEQIGVRVEGIVNNNIQETKIDLAPQKIQTLFYTNKKGFINWNKAIPNGYTPETTMQIVATPYFITPKNLSDVNFSWTRNAEPAGDSQYILVTPGTDSSVSFTLTAENAKTFFQSIKASLLLTL
ncbi:MAG: hypothetical protein ACR2IQ_01575 [Minisyncoccia bacterium]